MAEWRSIPSLPGYEVSDIGQLRRTFVSKGRPVGSVLGGWISSRGYRVFTVHDGGRQRHAYAHRLVCEAFHGPPPSPTHHAAHGDGDKSNNRSSNLRWATPAENTHDRWKHGTMPCGERHPRARLTSEEVAQIRALRGTILRQEIADRFQVSKATIKDIHLGRTWRIGAPLETDKFEAAG